MAQSIKIKQIIKRIFYLSLQLLTIAVIFYGFNSYRQMVSKVKQQNVSYSFLDTQNMSGNQQNLSPQHFSKNRRQLLQLQQGLIIPKKLWIYSITQNSSLPHQSFAFPFKELFYMNRLNNIQIAQQENYVVNYVSDKNYSNYLSDQSSIQINKIIKLLEKRYQGKEPTDVFYQMINETQNVTKRLITYFLIKQHGGVFIDDRVTLLQPFKSFFKNVKINRNINKGNLFLSFQINQTGKCIGFYNDKFSSMKQTVDFLIRDYEVQKSVVKFPNVEDYFIACGKDSRYVEEWLKVYVDLLMNEGESEFLDKTDKSQEMIGMTDTRKIYEHGHFIATHILLQKQQSVLQEKSPNKYLAIDSLSLLTINSRLGPTKLESQYASDKYKPNVHLTKLTVQQLEIFIGKMKYVYCMQQTLAHYLMWRLSWDENDHQFVVKGSFVDKYLLRMIKKLTDQQMLNKFGSMAEGLKRYNVMKNIDAQREIQIQKLKLQPNHLLLPPYCPNCHHRLAINESSLKWSSLQRNIWVIWDNGIEKSNFIVEMCFQNLKLSAYNSNFTINLVSKDNVKDFISKDMITKINNAISNASFDLSNQAISDLWRLALVYEHGGVYFDASTFQIDESFEWILNVTQFPRSLIWNRYGDEPNVFMLWNAYYGSPLDWHYDKEQDTRSQWHLSYENNFIAAVKGSELIREWLDVMMEWIQLPFDIVQQQMDAAGMKGHCWTYSSPFLGPFRYLTAMDAIKYVVGRRQKLNQQQSTIGKAFITAAYYYKLWSMPGQMIGQQKFRGQTNYQNSDYRSDRQSRQLNNIYRYKYAFKDVQESLGPAIFQVKFFGYDLIYMNKYINDFYSQNKQDGKDFDFKKLNKVFHPKSVLAEKLFNRFPNNTIECLKKYSQMFQMKIKLKAANKVWMY